MTFEDAVPYLIAAIAALFGFFANKYFPTIRERLADEQEHRQRVDELNTSYQLSVGSEAHRMMGDLLVTSQEDKRLSDDFVRNDVKKDLETIAGAVGNLTAAVNRLIETEENKSKLFTLQNGILSDMSHDLRSQQAKITSLIELLKNE